MDTDTLEMAAEVTRKRDEVEAALQMLSTDITRVMDDSTRFVAATTHGVNPTLSQQQIAGVYAQFSSKFDEMLQLVSRRFAHVPLPVARPISSPSRGLSAVFRFELGLEGIGERQFRRPLGVADHLGELHVADNGNQRICVYTRYGAFIKTIKLLDSPTCVSSTPSGNLLVTTEGDELLVIKDGDIVKTIGKSGDEPGEFHQPHCVTCDPHNRIYVCDTFNHRIQILEETGKVIQIIDSTDDAKIINPAAVAIDPTNYDIYVCSFQMAAVNIYDQYGYYKGKITAENIGELETLRPNYVSFSPDGMLCLSDADSVIYLMRGGEIVQALGKEGTKPGEFNFPMGTCFVGSDLAICDWGNHRVQVFTGL